MTDIPTLQRKYQIMCKLLDATTEFTSFEVFAMLPLLIASMIWSHTDDKNYDKVLTDFGLATKDYIGKLDAAHHGGVPLQ